MRCSGGIRSWINLGINKQREYLDLKAVHKKQMEEKQYNKRNNSSLEILNDKMMLDTLQSHENDIIAREKLDDQNRKLTYKKFLDEQAASDKALGFNSSQNYSREFELSKDLIKEISPNKSTLI